LTLKRLGKKLLKITGIFLGVIAVLLIAFHFWFINHAKGMMEDIVSKRTNGRIKLKINKLRYNYFSQKMELDNAVFYTTDTLTAPSAYRFKVAQLRIQLNALLPLILNKQLLIDSLFLQSPDIQVTVLRHTANSTQKKEKDNISIPYEMGKIYKSIQDGLKVLNVSRFTIEDGKFSLINKADAEQLPLTISRLHFRIDNLKVDTGRLSGKEKLMFSDNVVMRTRNQAILFPDGRHKLSFSKFHINLKKQLVEFDSCTIEATKKDTTGSSFKVFFDALLLTNIDFDTLYRAEVIKADSVYCINPKFILEVGPGSASKKKEVQTQAGKLETIIEQLTGDLQLGYVGMENADFNIKSVKNGKPNSFVFTKNNFDMEGLSIDQEATKPIKVKKFAMAIRNYENFIKDSTYTIKFDSIIFNNNRLILSNFLFNKLSGGKIINTFSVPQFSLEGLSWDNLVFEKKLKARVATMYQPHISYTASGKHKKQQNFFHSLGAVNDYMDLDQLDIKNGNIDLVLKKDLKVRLDNATLSVQSHSLLRSTQISGIKNSLTTLNFDKGSIQAGNLHIELKEIHYTGTTGQFSATAATVTNKEKDLSASLQKVAVAKLFIDEGKGSILAEGINWQQGDITIHKLNERQSKESSATIDIKGIQGSNTYIHTLLGDKTISTFLSQISIHELILKQGYKPLLTGLIAKGTGLKAAGNTLSVSVDKYAISDNNPSLMEQVHYKSKDSSFTADIILPSVSFVPHIQPILNGALSLDDVRLNKPTIQIHETISYHKPQLKKNFLSLLTIGNLLLTQPYINFTRQNDSGQFRRLQWHGEPGDFLQLKGLHSSFAEGEDIHFDQLKFSMSGFQLRKPNGKSFDFGKGKITGQLDNSSFIQKNEDGPEWNTTITDLDVSNFSFDSLGKKKGRFVLNSAQLKNAYISSSLLLNRKQLIITNKDFQLKNFTGHYFTPGIELLWYNAAFSRPTGIFSLDSFSFSPDKGIDSFLLTRKFQTDYLKTSTGAIEIGPVDIDTYINDSILNIRKVTIQNAFLFDHKDKTLPFNGGLIKPLPVDLLKKIPLRLTLDTVQLNNASVQYSEVNDKTKITGTIPVKRMTVTLLNVKNYKATHSDTLRIRATGYLLDTVWIRLRVNESYTDSLGSFVMTLRLKAGDLTLLNKILIPMASVKLVSGELDTLNMRAIGREYLSLGEMKMYYRNLKIQLLKGGKDVKQPFFTRLLSFGANTFLLRKNNNSRPGNVFFIRQRDRSAINYLIKIAMSGMMSSVGIKNNRKMIRQYKHELEKRKLPAIELN
jgi:hypothetical protein